MEVNISVRKDKLVTLNKKKWVLWLKYRAGEEKNTLFNFVYRCMAFQYAGSKIEKKEGKRHLDREKQLTVIVLQ